jgi:hypothetical protein
MSFNFYSGNDIENLEDLETFGKQVTTLVMTLQKCLEIALEILKKLSSQIGTRVNIPWIFTNFIKYLWT